MLSSGDRYLWTSWRDGHNHIYLYQFDKENPLSGEAKLVAQLTHGDWDVESIDGVDRAARHRLFLCQRRGLAAEERFCRGAGRAEFPPHLQGERFARLPTSIPRISKYYVDHYSALTTPPSLSLCTIDGHCKAFWNARSVEAYNFLTPKFVDFKAADGTTTLEGVSLAAGERPDDGQRQSAPHPESLRRAGGTGRA